MKLFYFPLVSGKDMNRLRMLAATWQSHQITNNQNRMHIWKAGVIRVMQGLCFSQPLLICTESDLRLKEWQFVLFTEPPDSCIKPNIQAALKTHIRSSTENPGVPARFNERSLFWPQQPDVSRATGAPKHAAGWLEKAEARSTFGENAAWYLVAEANQENWPLPAGNCNMCAGENVGLAKRSHESDS